MATKTIVTLTCDICAAGGEEADATETISVQVAGKSGELDLCETDAALFRDVTEPWLAAVHGPAPRRRPIYATSHGTTGKSRTKHDRLHTAQMRTWAKDQGIQVNDKGRLAVEVIAAYAAAH